MKQNASVSHCGFTKKRLAEPLEPVCVQFEKLLTMGMSSHSARLYLKTGTDPHIKFTFR